MRAYIRRNRKKENIKKKIYIIIFSNFKKQSKDIKKVTQALNFHAYK